VRQRPPGLACGCGCGCGCLCLRLAFHYRASSKHAWEQRATGQEEEEGRRMA